MLPGLGQGERRLHSYHRRGDAKGREADRPRLAARLHPGGDQSSLAALKLRRTPQAAALLAGAAGAACRLPLSSNASQIFADITPGLFVIVWVATGLLLQNEAPRPDQCRQRASQPLALRKAAPRARPPADRRARGQLSADRLDPVAGQRTQPGRTDRRPAEGRVGSFDGLSGRRRNLRLDRSGRNRDRPSCRGARRPVPQPGQDRRQAVRHRHQLRRRNRQRPLADQPTATAPWSRPTRRRPKACAGNITTPNA